MSESDTMFNKRDQRCTAVQLMLSTDPSYDNRTIASTLKMQIWIATNNRDVPRVMKTKFLATVMVFGVVSSEGHIMPPHIFEVAWKSTPKCTWMYWRVCWSPGAIRWPVADPGCGSRTWCQSTSPKRPRLGFRRSATALYLFLTTLLLPRPEPAGLLCLVICWEHHQHDLPQSQSQPDRPPSTEYSPSSRRHFWKRHAPSSGSVSRRWLRLKAATLSRCHLYYIIKLPELIFSIKVLK